jgi:hypothetical protein
MRLKYLPFMNLGAQSLSSPIHLPKEESRSTGKERDSETGLDYFGARYNGSNTGGSMNIRTNLLPV